MDSEANLPVMLIPSGKKQGNRKPNRPAAKHTPTKRLPTRGKTTPRKIGNAKSKLR